MASSTIPYIGSKISLISNSNIRYEGILYTINTQESTIALQSVRSFGTEGRKVPEIPPSSEIYDFIIFRGQDIKDLTVLEGGSGGPGASPHLNDPAIMSMKRPPSDDKGVGKGPSKGAPAYPSNDGWGQAKGGKPSYGAADWGKGAADKGWGKPSDKGYGKSMDKGYSGGYSSGKGYEKGYDKGYDRGYDDKGKGKDMKGKGKDMSMDKGYGKGSSKGAETSKGKSGGKDDMGKGKKGMMDTGKGKTGKGEMKGKGESKGKGKIEVKGKASGKGDTGKAGKGEKGKSSGGKGKGGKKGGGEGGSSIGELLPEENEQVKKEYAAEFDVAAANEKFDKAAIANETDEGATATLKPLTGYDKTKSFFDSISCEATERSGAADRPKADVAKMRSMDRETFGDARRPPRPGGRGGKGKGYRS
mmetsp:Transcript_106921/g.190064  ORF Transcript_106921/g.190064 Transcript_106921/m.190064 type:complete len:417 (+) Transcript_106921:103-1353(+)